MVKFIHYTQKSAEKDVQFDDEFCVIFEILSFIIRWKFYTL